VIDHGPWRRSRLERRQDRLGTVRHRLEVIPRRRLQPRSSPPRGLACTPIAWDAHVGAPPRPPRSCPRPLSRPARRRGERRGAHLPAGRAPPRLQRSADRRQPGVALEAARSPWGPPLQTPRAAYRAALADRPCRMTALPARCSPIRFGPLTPRAGAMAARRRRRAVSFGVRCRPPCRPQPWMPPPVAPSGGRRPPWGPTRALVGLVPTQPSPPPLEAARGLRHGTQPPNMARAQLHQDTSSVCGPGMACESREPRRTCVVAECDRGGSLHGGGHPSDRQPSTTDAQSVGWHWTAGVADDVWDVKRDCRKVPEP
jgi:hypothetical protein